MESNPETKICILGGGLAGFFLAGECIRRGQEVILFSDPGNAGASGVAAGLVNPVTGRQYALSWRTPELLDALEQFFRDPLFQSLSQYFHRKEIFRPFPDIFSCNEWSGKSGQIQFAGLTRPEYEPYAPELIFNPHGGMVHLRTGWLEIPPFLLALSEKLSETGRFRHIRRKLDYTQIFPETGEIRLPNENIPFSSFIFCEGVSVTDNPWFRIRMAPLKGQVLTISSNAKPERIISSGVFIVPLGNSTFRVGSTYERNYTYTKPDESGKAELITELQRWWRPEIQSILKHESGIRPATPDRMPVIGRHADLPKLWIFNGLGAKGVLQAPGMAALLAEAILMNQPEILYPEIRANRPKLKQ